MKHLGYMAVDQYGAVEHLGDTERRAIEDRIGIFQAVELYQSLHWHTYDKGFPARNYRYCHIYRSGQVLAIAIILRPVC